MNQSMSSESQGNGPNPAAAAGPGRAGAILRALCFVAAAANMGGNLVLFFTYEPVFAWLGVPLPADPYTFTSVLGFSFTAGALALACALRPVKAAPFLAVAVVGKGLFAVITLGFHLDVGLSWPWLVFGAFDGVFAAVFWLYLIHLSRPELLALNRGAIVAGSPRPRARKALLLCYSLSGNADRATERVRAGLAARGYACTVVPIQPVERALFRFPFGSLWQFTRIAARAVLRRPADIEPIGVPADHDHDLIVVSGQTWMVGVAAPVEALFLDARVRGIFAGRDVALVNVCRGLWRRSQAMLASHVQAAGGHLVGASAHTNPGWEPVRTLSLLLFLAFGKQRYPGWLPDWFFQAQMLDQAALERLERFGQDLAARPMPAWSAVATPAAPPAAPVDLLVLDQQAASAPRLVTGEESAPGAAQPAADEPAQEVGA